MNIANTYLCINYTMTLTCGASQIRFRANTVRKKRKHLHSAGHLKLGQRYKEMSDVRDDEVEFALLPFAPSPRSLNLLGVSGTPNAVCLRFHPSRIEIGKINARVSYFVLWVERSRSIICLAAQLRSDM